MAAHWLLQKAGRQRHRKCSRFRALSIVFVFAIRGAMPDSPNPPPETSESSRSRGELYQTLRTRCRDLEMSHRKLQEQFETLLKEKEKDRLAEEEEERRTVWKGDGENIKRGCIPGFFVNSAYWHVLQSMGHALHISRACTGEIIYWNQAAENLYGWKDYEVLGQRAADLLINEENRVFDKKITEDLNGGQSWSGQFPLRKRSGEVFMAMVTKSLLYEDGKCIGVITVSSDAAVFNQINFEILRTRREHAYGQPREWRLSMKKIQWHSKPQIASSVSNLVSKVFSRRRGESGCKIENAERREMMQQTEAVQAKKDEIQASNPSFGFNVQKKTTEANSHRKEETVSELSQPSKIAAKVLPKFFVGTDNNTQEHCKNNQLDSSNVSGINHMKRAQGQVNEDNSRNGASRAPKPPTRGRYSDGDDGRNQKTFAEDSSAVYKNSLFPSLGCSECYAMQKFGDWLPPLLSEQNRNEQTQHYPDSQHEVLLEKSQNPDSKLSSTVSSSGGSVGSSHSSSTKGEKGPNSLVDCEIHWEDLVLGEEIGQGSSGIVYRGIWNGSDVAIKVYMGCEYREGIFLDYKKEIAIMKRLRHPNVLLFMGAVYSPDRLAIVTEFLPRGSLFKVLHKNNQALDLKRRLRMALDVVRGMNYLHCRNPPIVHRDLKSSNLLVDRKWTVKVGDFGLSCLKNSAFLTPKSGRGTPQWMAPEVLRNEPSNEKSDVFSFGVILWELMTESVPWSHLNALQTTTVVSYKHKGPKNQPINTVMKAYSKKGKVVGVVGYMDRRLDLPEGLDPRIASIIRDCWLSEPEKRPAFEHILQRVGDVISTVVVATSRKNKDPQF